MNNKILINIYVPKIEQIYEVFIPISKNIYNVTKLLEQSIKELSQNEYTTNGTTLLYNEYGKLIKPNVLVKDSGLVNGSKIIII